MKKVWFSLSLSFVCGLKSGPSQQKNIPTPLLVDVILIVYIFSFNKRKSDNNVVLCASALVGP
jgi:hypothetical protein